MPSLSRRKLLAIAAGSVAGLALPTPSWAARSPLLTPGDQQVVGGVSAARALKDLRVLTETIGPRVAGTAGERRAADYLAGVFDDLGYDTTLQPFAVADKYLAKLDAAGGLPPRSGLAGRRFPVQESLDDTVRAGVVDAGLGGAADYPENVTGKIVMIDNPWLEDPGVLAGRAVERGAAAIVFLAERPVRAVDGRRRGARGGAGARWRSRWSARPGRRRPAARPAGGREAARADRQHVRAPGPDLAQRARGAAPRKAAPGRW